MVTIGFDAINRPTAIAYLNTAIYTGGTFSVTGKITNWSVYVNGTSGTCPVKVKVFRSSGGNWVFVNEGSWQICSPGLNNITEEITGVVSGDYFGFSTNDTGGKSVEATTGTSAYQTYNSGGDVTTTTSQGSWTSLTIIEASLLVTYIEVCTTYNDVYVNSSTGNDSACGATSGTPVQTFGRAYVLLNSAGNIHVLNSGADFSGETVTLNKSFSIDLNGSSGNFYGPKAS